ncbi:hypothetical protein Sru01_07510 [Sphaerisporangium rufum]|uniref:Uncharacterized protein n=1 Tax=Sphaerisporangium rufum TaxID=1381558 RepID=A0A919QX88_9ACTN|nr:hypothetical protein [Sphaerisporangium rufum]GII75769.1 hypothetical protein Sru01_07510 [Sphaerisporangium rufum]
MQPTIRHPAIRALRAAVFAMVCGTVSLGGHVLAGGASVRPQVAVAAIAATGLLGLALGGRRRGPGTLLAACFAAQYGMHQLFGAGAAPPDGPHPAGHHGGHATGDLPAALVMLLVHVLVALLSAWWLARGDTALATLLLTLACSLPPLRRTLALLQAAGPAAPCRPAPRRAAGGPAATGRPAASPLSRRGPPALARA